MKRSMWVRLIAVILVISMLAAPVSAATASSSSSYGTYGLIGGIISIIRDIIRDIFDDWFDGPGDEVPDPTDPSEPEETTAPTDPEETTTPTDPTEPEETDPTEPSEPDETEPSEPEQTPETVLNLIEGHANTENGHLLRGVTYSLGIKDEAEAQTAPYALRSTGASTFALNAAATTAETSEESGTTISDTPLEITTDDLGAVIPDGEYLIRYNHATYGSYMTSNTSSGWPWYTTFLLGTTDEAAATHFTFTRQDDGTYTIQAPDGTYMDITGNNSGEMTTDVNYFTIEMKDDGIWIRDFDDNVCVNALGADFSDYTEKYYGGYSDGTPMELYAVTTTDTEEPEEPEQPETEAELIYFPVTMFNYDQDVIRAATNQAEVEKGLAEEWNGLYFSGGKPAATDYTYTTTAATHTDLTWQQVMDGTYYADEACTNKVSVNEVIEGGDAYQSVNVNDTMLKDSIVETVGTNKYISSYYAQHNSTFWYPEYNGNYYPVYFEIYDTYCYAYYYLDNGATQNVGYPSDSETVVMYKRSGTVTGYTLTAGGNTLATLDGTDTSAKVGISLYSAGGSTTVNKTYAEWNWWAYKTANDDARNKFYAGLVEDELVNGEIKFTNPDPGIFTFDASEPTKTNDGLKDIYQNVGLPFVMNDKGYYTFDSDAHGTYFADTNGDEYADPSYGASDNYFNMYFDYQKTQGWSGMYYGDGSSNLWAPFNTNVDDDYGEYAIDYHFGMRADIPFSMTSNGRIKSTDDNSEPITFTFAGDDDVWIFIDGHLVIDLGGIHNRLGATIDFANNTITYFKPESNTNNNTFGAFNIEDFELVQKLYTDAEGEGALGQTRLDFSSEEEHEMSIFYLERGMGTSNCKIEFNLPMRDTLLITKDATKSWSEEQDAADGDAGDGTVSLTAKEQAAVNNILFGFTLYKKTAEETEFTAVENTNYYVQDKDGNVQGIQSTDGNGKFYLKNGQTAKFMTDFPKEGVTYYVVEDTVPTGFLTPDYQYDGVCTGGMDWYDSTEENPEVSHVTLGKDIPEQELDLNATENKSYIVTAKGSIESIDSLEFICVNYLDAELPNPTALAYEDIIVIDYGLPVHIDPLANDVFRGDDIEIVAWGDESLELNEVLDEFGNATNATSWDGTQNLHSGTVQFNDVDYAEVTGSDNKTTYTRDTFTYTLNKQLTEVEVISYIIKVNSELDVIIDGKPTGETKSACRYALAKVYIVPATIMYYEENFNGLVTYSGTGTQVGLIETDGASDHQEPGVVGTIGDSTYGSDVAYLSDSYDSNGTSYKLDTTDGYVRFQYTFTGTGTTFFARTSALTGYMQVLLFKGDTVGAAGEQIDTYYRDTYYNDTNGYAEDANGTLYNIPVYTNDNLDYGTYTVLVTVAKKGTKGAGPVTEDGTGLGSMNEFYLDGIRIMQPLNESNNTVVNEETQETITDKALGAYATDGESNLDVVTLRQKIITDAQIMDDTAGIFWDNENFVVLTDTNGDITTAEEYTSIGPKEEVYLAPGQKVSFSLKYWQPEGLKLYMGMKAPFGSAALNVGDTPFKLKNATDCFYDVTNSYASLITKYEQAMDENYNLLFTDPTGAEVYMDSDGNFFYSSTDVQITEEINLTPIDDLNQPYFVVTYTFESTSSIVSLTNIKVVGNYEFTIVEDTDINLDGSYGEGEDNDGTFEGDEEESGDEVTQP